MHTRLKLASLAALTLLFGLALAATQWTLQPGESQLTFVATQAGAKFEGRFEKFEADITFDPESLAGARFDVRVDLRSVNTQDSERDSIIKGPDLFDVDRWPTAHYVADSFTAKGGGKFTARGKLTLRDVTRVVPIEFTFERANGGAWLKGSATLNRLDFGVGQGEWKDTESVGNEVAVRFSLRLM
ncbi:MAG TPA: YceI family protein [Steroidobacteraceae bacterium]|jgi:polyisoprenoid-binding protein YceI